MTLHNDHSLEMGLEQASTHEKNTLQMQYDNNNILILFKFCIQS